LKNLAGWQDKIEQTNPDLKDREIKIKLYQGKDNEVISGEQDD
jgi:hypothetical protein